MLTRTRPDARPRQRLFTYANAPVSIAIVYFVLCFMNGNAIYNQPLTKISATASSPNIGSDVLDFVPKGDQQSATCDTTIGWACDQDNFNQALEIHIYKDGPAGGGGILVGTVTANAPRGAAVAGQCGGNVNHGFTFKTPDTLKDGKAHSLYVYAINIGQGANRLLSHSPKTITCQPAVTVNPKDDRSLA